MSCIICGEDLKSKFSISLDCNCKSLFHYECIQSTLLYDKYNKCPYCAKSQMKIPIVNGIKRINPKVHIIDENNPFENKMCQCILKSGKNKGEMCNKNCKLGYNTCARHLKSQQAPL